MNNNKNKYNSEFYRLMTNKQHPCNNLTSAQEVVPFILKMFPNTNSIVDVGCGIGTWASAFKKNGVKKILGLDGPWVDKQQLLIMDEEFCIYDIEKAEKNFDEKFDIAVCLEVAEHLEEKYADKLVDTLTSLSDIVVFSAAIPNQGGTNHVNEQYQSYWKTKFEKQNYKGIDLVRPHFVHNERVSYVYSQNMLVYVNKNKDYPNIKKYMDAPFVVDMVSPKNRPARGTNTWKYLFYVQKQLIRAYIKKLLMTIGFIKHQ